VFGVPLVGEDASLQLLCVM